MGSQQLFRTTGLLFAFAASSAIAAYDANDLTLGASEAEIKKNFPNAYCRELEWPSRAAERRCDDSRISFAGVDASVTFYLKRGEVEGFDVRFDRRELARVKDFQSEEHTSELQSRFDLVCRLLLEKKKI